MSSNTVQRRLAAILAADVAGYSRLMGEDEEGTLATLTAHIAELIKPCIADHRGRIVKTTGDGLLAEFASVVDAVRCAVAFQEGMTTRNSDEPEDRRIVFRIGVNIGDVIVQDDDVFGDGVNVAARLEGLAEPGGVVVSGIVHETVRTKLDFGFDNLGPQTVKNIVDPVHAYKVTPAFPKDGNDTFTPLDSVFRLPSIAVLPFDNMSGDSEQEYFSDGITEDVITALSRIRQFRVISRNSTFSYKGQSPDARKASKDLDAEYLIEGSVRKAGKRIRFTAQLIDGATGKHLWAERYDRELDDIFAVQDELTESVTAAISPEVQKAEQQRALRKSPERLDAWDLYQKGMWHLHQRTIADTGKARELFECAIEVDPQFGPAYASYSWSYFYSNLFGVDQEDLTPALRAAHKAVELDPGDAVAHYALGFVHYIDRDNDAAIPEFEMSIELDPSFAQAYHGLATSLAHSGQSRQALPYLHTAIRLSPHDDMIGPFYVRLALANLYLREHDQAVDWAKTAIRIRGVQWPAYAYLASALGHQGRSAEAKHAVDELQEFRPGITLSFVRQRLPTTDLSDKEYLIDGLRKAGLPEELSENDKIPPLPDKPSIAVLPFENMSGDPEQAYFADGIAEDIITGLSRLRWLFVIARNSSFTYKGRNVDVREIGRELGVRYVLEGSVRRAGQRIRITGQLIEAETGNHLWAERYDRSLDDIFEIQDQITESVIGCLQPELYAAEHERLKRKPPRNLDAWEHFVRGMFLYSQHTDAGTKEALAVLGNAVTLDPDYAQAHGLRAVCLMWRAFQGWEDVPTAISKAGESADRAVTSNPHEPWAYFAKGFIAVAMRRDAEADSAFRRATEESPNFAYAHGVLGANHAFAGRPDQAIECIENGLRLSPRDTFAEEYHLYYAFAYFQAGRYAEAAAAAHRAVQLRPGHPNLYIMAAASHALTGDREAAVEIVRQITKLVPDLSAAAVSENFPYYLPEDRERLADALRTAGLPG